MKLFNKDLKSFGIKKTPTGWEYSSCALGCFFIVAMVLVGVVL